MYRIIALITTLFLTVINAGLLVSANDSNIYFSASSHQGLVGDNVTVEISITNNPGFASYTIDVGYLPDYVSIASSSKGMLDDIYAGGAFANNNNYSADCARFVFSSAENVTADGVLFNITFNIKQAPIENIDIPVSVSVSFLDDEDWKGDVLTEHAVSTDGKLHVKTGDAVLGLTVNNIEQDGKNISYSVTLDNNTESTIPLLFAVAAYKFESGDDELKLIGYYTQKGELVSQLNLDGSFDIETTQCNAVKIFVWDSFKKIIPLIPHTDIPMAEQL